MFCFLLLSNKNIIRKRVLFCSYCACSNVLIPLADCIGNECKFNGQSCQKCNLAYHLEDGKCVANNCKCTNGVRVEPELCYRHNSEICAKCNKGYYLNVKGITFAICQSMEENLKEQRRKHKNDLEEEKKLKQKVLDECMEEERKRLEEADDLEIDEDKIEEIDTSGEEEEDETGNFRDFSRNGFEIEENVKMKIAQSIRKTIEEPEKKPKVFKTEGRSKKGRRLKAAGIPQKHDFHPFRMDNSPGGDEIYIEVKMAIYDIIINIENMLSEMDHFKDYYPINDYTTAKAN